MTTPKQREILGALLRDSQGDPKGARELPFLARHPEDQEEIDELVRTGRIRRTDGHMLIHPIATAEIAPTDPFATDIHRISAALFDDIRRHTLRNPEASIRLGDLARRVKMSPSDRPRLLRHIAETGIFASYGDLSNEDALLQPAVSFILRHKTYEDLIDRLRQAAGDPPLARSLLDDDEETPIAHQATDERGVGVSDSFEAKVVRGGGSAQAGPALASGTGTVNRIEGAGHESRDNRRVTEDGQPRVTEAGNPRVIQGQVAQGPIGGYVRSKPEPPSDGGIEDRTTLVIEDAGRAQTRHEMRSGAPQVDGSGTVTSPTSAAQATDPSPGTGARASGQGEVRTATGDLKIEQPAPSTVITGSADARLDELTLAATGTVGPGPRRIGGLQNTSREASEDELCLNVRDYAAVLAALFSGADRKEFCLAIYGQWGRGKTFLMRHVAAAVEQLKDRYETIRFSAWKYPTAPEVWVHLYEEFAKAALQGPWYQTLPKTVRTGIAKHGSLQLLAALLLFATSVIPIGALFQWTSELVRYIYPTIGVVGFIWFLGIILGVRRTQRRLSDTYLTAGRHTEKLGLQATIGTDLAALLKGWIPTQGFGWFFWFGYGTAALVLAGATWLRLQSGAEFESIANDTFDWNLAIQSEPSFTWLATAFVLLIWILSGAWLRYGGHRPDRLLLIVDDLDRCKPEHLLSVMESIKLLIEDVEISRRVQVAMLLEEDILRHAIVTKYSQLAKDEMSTVLKTPYDNERLIRENCEKLFTAHLRLPALGSKDIRALIESFSGRTAMRREQRQVAERTRKDLQQELAREPFLRIKTGTSTQSVPTRMVRGEPGNFKDVDVPEYRDATPVEAQAIKQQDAQDKLQRLAPQIDAIEREIAALADVDDPPPPEEDTETLGINRSRVLEEQEIDAILAALAADAGETRSNLGPRAVRAFLFRYQLARLLLRRLRIPWEPTALARELARLYNAPSSETTGTKPIPTSLPDNEKLIRIVEQVS